MRAWLLLASLLPAPALAEAAGQWRGPQQIWGAACGYCHGEGIGPEIRGLKLPPETIVATARNGAPGMPAFHPSEIDDRELAALARWISTAPTPPPKK